MKNNLILYICDDNIDFAQKIKQEIKKITINKRTCEICIFDNGRELIKKWDSQIADAVFLDIDMPEINGFELAEQIQKRKEDAYIIFITNHEDKVYQSYEYHPFWFIRKSHLNDLDIIFSKLIQKIDAEEDRKYLVAYLHTDNANVEININTLVYIESSKNDIIINDKIKEPLKVRSKISLAEKQLYPYNIIRIQNGILVNCRFVSKITSREVILIDGTRLNLSRSRIDYVKQEYQRYVRTKII